jgi:hypothetical protein
MPSIAELHGKGETWQRFDRLFSRRDLRVRRNRKARVLEFLYSGASFTSFEYDSSLTPEQLAELKDHIDTDWFGGRGWPSWKGDTEGIVRETVIRALEVSLGLPHHDRSTPARPVSLEDSPRNWPIEFWSVSGAPYFAASVTWRHDRDDPQRGLVIVTWLTPSEATFLSGAGAAVLNPTEAAEWTGSWIIRHEQNEVSSPPPDVRSGGEIVTVSPAPDSGGVDAGLDY